MLTDAEVAAGLHDEVRTIPYPGRWLEPPFDGEQAAVVAQDPGLSELRVNRATGRVDLIDLHTGAAELIALSLSELGMLASAYAAALDSTRGVPADELCRVERTLLRAITVVSPGLACDGSFWTTAAEEIGSGTIGAEESGLDPVTIPAADGPTVVIAMLMSDLRRTLAAEGLRLLGYRGMVSYVTLSGGLDATLSGTAQPDLCPAGPAQVLVVDQHTALTTDDLAFDTLRMIVLLAPATLAETLTVPDGAEVVTIGGDAPFAQLADLIARRAADGTFDES